MDLKVFISSSESECNERGEKLGILIEEAALQRAELECLSDADTRALQQAREAERRAELDQEYILHFAARVRELCDQEIAQHACQKYSERVGRSASAKKLDEKAIHLAVIAHIHHAETNYDELLAQGWERFEARNEVENQIKKVLPALKDMAI